MRISRPCYDKPHRCPARAGGGMRYAKIQRCESGMLSASYCRRYWLGTRCPDCGVLVLPIAVQWLDWRWLKYAIRSPHVWPIPWRVRRFWWNAVDNWRSR